MMLNTDFKYCYYMYYFSFSVCVYLLSFLCIINFGALLTLKKKYDNIFF